MHNGSDPNMNRRRRIYAAGELCLLSLSFWATIWGPAYGGVAAWNVAAGSAFFITIALSAILRRPGWEDSGFRIDNFRPALLRVGAMTICLVGLIIVALKLLGVPFFWLSGKTLVDRLLFGIFQQALLIGYLFPRWMAVLPHPVLAAVANSIWFALVHVPDGALVALAGVGGIFFHWLFLRTRNVFAIGLAHGALSFVALPLLLGTGVMRTPRIGPPQLSSFSAAINRESKPLDRIGNCSALIATDQFGPSFDRRVELVIDGRAGEQFKRESFSRFLTGTGRVFCVVTEREFERWTDPSLRKKIYLLGDRFAWRNWKDGLSFPGDDGLLGLFRERVLLISNQPVN
jgi:hypothetical protein